MRQVEINGHGAHRRPRVFLSAIRLEIGTRHLPADCFRRPSSRLQFCQGQASHLPVWPQGAPSNYLRGWTPPPSVRLAHQGHNRWARLDSRVRRDRVVDTTERQMAFNLQGSRSSILCGLEGKIGRIERLCTWRRLSTRLYLKGSIAKLGELFASTVKDHGDCLAGLETFILLPADTLWLKRVAKSINAGENNVSVAEHIGAARTRRPRLPRSLTTLHPTSSRSRVHGSTTTTISATANFFIDRYFLFIVLSTFVTS
ncbi:hypothetical protein OF83DRAFT_1150962 [Amylostereum chailletii]|nr:hypothetical protein OF83DRAFT_1150962 [Amylostereum chailletii]